MLHNCFLNEAVAIVLTCCVCTPSHTTFTCEFPHLKMELFEKLSAVGHLTGGESDGNHSFNGTNLTTPVVREPCVVCLVEAPLYLAVLVFILVVLALVAAAKTLPLVIRFVLANILIANFTAGLGVLMLLLTRSIVTRVRHFSLTDGPCRFLFAIISVGGTIRPVIMAAFAVVVGIIIMKSISAVKIKVLSICVLTIWLLCVAFSSTILFPSILKVSILQDGAGCFPRPGPYGLVYTVPFFVCFLLIPFSLTVVILITAFCYARFNSVSDSVTSLRPLLKFSTFLLLGALLSALGQSMPVISAYVDSTAPEVNLTLILSNGIIILLSIIPTPILVLVYFKPVRSLMKWYFLCVCRKVGKNAFKTSGQKHLADKMLFSRGV